MVGDHFLKRAARIPPEFIARSIDGGVCDACIAGSAIDNLDGDLRSGCGSTCGDHLEDGRRQSRAEVDGIESSTDRKPVQSSDVTVDEIGHVDEIPLT